MVAGGVFTLADVDRVVWHLLDLSSDQPSIALLGCHTLNKGLLRTEVVGDGIHRVG